MKKPLIFLLIVMYFILLASVAFAADTAEHVINIKESILAAIALTFSVVSTAVVFLINKVFGPNKLIPLDEKHIGYVEALLQAAIDKGKEKALYAAQNINDPTVKSEIVADVANFILKQLPQLASHYGLNKDNISQFVRDRLN